MINVGKYTIHGLFGGDLFSSYRNTDGCDTKKSGMLKKYMNQTGLTVVGTFWSEDIFFTTQCDPLKSGWLSDAKGLQTSGSMIFEKVVVQDWRCYIATSRPCTSWLYENGKIWIHPNNSETSSRKKSIGMSFLKTKLASTKKPCNFWQLAKKQKSSIYSISSEIIQGPFFFGSASQNDHRPTTGGCGWNTPAARCAERESIWAYGYHGPVRNVTTRSCRLKHSLFRGASNFYVQKVILLGTNISPPKGSLKMIFLFPRWDMLVSWRVVTKRGGCCFGVPVINSLLATRQPRQQLLASVRWVGR